MSWSTKLSRGDYQVVDGDDKFPHGEEQGEREEEPRHRHQSSWAKLSPVVSVCLSVSLCLSLVFNVWLLQRNERLLREVAEPMQRSEFANLAYDVRIPFNMTSKYSSQNETLSDELWDAIKTDHGAVALSDDYAQTHGLPIARRFPWDTSKGLYYIQGVHMMHCIKTIRRSHREYARGVPQTVDPWHTKHCFDALRLAVTCSALDTPFATRDPPLDTGEGQIMKCRSWEGLRDWALSPERNACFLGADESFPEQGIERFGNCPVGSPYKEKAAQYLAELKSQVDQS